MGFLQIGHHRRGDQYLASPLGRGVVVVHALLHQIPETGVAGVLPGEGARSLPVQDVGVTGALDAREFFSVPGVVFPEF